MRKRGKRFEQVSSKATDFQLRLVRPDGAKESADARTSLGQDQKQSLEQTIVKKEDLRFERSGGIDTTLEEAILRAGILEYGQEEHTGREEEVERMDSGEGSDSEVFKRKR